MESGLFISVTVELKHKRVAWESAREQLAFQISHSILHSQATNQSSSWQETWKLFQVKLNKRCLDFKVAGHSQGQDSGQMKQLWVVGAQPANPSGPSMVKGNSHLQNKGHHASQFTWDHPRLPPLSQCECRCLPLLLPRVLRFVWGHSISSQPWMHPFQFSRSVVSSSLQPHGLQHNRLPWTSPTPEASFWILELAYDDKQQRSITKCKTKKTSHAYLIRFISLCFHITFWNCVNFSFLSTFLVVVHIFSSCKKKNSLSLGPSECQQYATSSWIWFICN